MAQLRKQAGAHAICCLDQQSSAAMSNTTVSDSSLTAQHHLDDKAAEKTALAVLVAISFCTAPSA
jgi:hypothetical protein